MTISEYAKRVKRLCATGIDIDAKFNPDEGLTLVAQIDGKRWVRTGEAEIVIELETAVSTYLSRAAAKLNEPIA